MVFRPMTCLTADGELDVSSPVQLKWYLCITDYFHICVNAVGLLASVRHWALPCLNSFSTPSSSFNMRSKVWKLFARKMPTHLCFSLKWLFWSVPRWLLKTLVYPLEGKLSHDNLEKLCGQNIFSFCCLFCQYCLTNPSLGLLSQCQWSSFPTSVSTLLLQPWTVLQAL